MNLGLQRWVDRWVGVPLCAGISVWEAVRQGLGMGRRAPPQPRGIVVILLSEMGSLVLAHEMFTRLQQRHPGTAVHVMLFGKNREILDLMRLVPPSQVHCVDDKSLSGLVSSLLRCLLALRRAKVDVAIDCELFSRISSLLAWACGASVRVGFHRHTQEGLFRGSRHMINRPVPYNPYQHIGVQFQGLVRAIDATAHPLTKLVSPAPVMGSTLKPPPPVALAAADVPAIQARLQQDFPTTTDKPLVLVYPGGGILPIRAWPLEHYEALCKALMADGCVVGVIGLRDDAPLAQALMQRCNPPGAPAHSASCLDFTGYTRSIRELLALFHVARLLVTNDGGPGQFAALTPIQTVMLFGPETPALYGPISPRNHNFYSQWPCSPCLTAYNHRNSFCDGDNQCLKVIAPAQVIAKARECLDQPMATGVA
jgi:ADP-heptose:LPS heptosyltransferase